MKGSISKNKKKPGGNPFSPDEISGGSSDSTIRPTLPTLTTTSITNVGSVGTGSAQALEFSIIGAAVNANRLSIQTSLVPASTQDSKKAK